MVINLLQDQTSRERVIQSLASMSSSQIVSATALHHKSVKSGSSSSSSAAHAAAAAGSNTRATLDTLRHANYHNHNGFTAATVLSLSLSTWLTFLSRWPPAKRRGIWFRRVCDLSVCMFVRRQLSKALTKKVYFHWPDIHLHGICVYLSACLKFLSCFPSNWRYRSSV